MRNPFIYGEVVTGRDFANRKDEVRRLLQDFAAASGLKPYSTL